MTQIAELERRRVANPPRAEHRQPIAKPIRPIARGEVLRIYRRTRRRLGVLGTSFIVGVIVPTLICTAYLVFAAPKEYLTEAKIVIRAASEDNTYAPVSMTSTQKAMSGNPEEGSNLSKAPNNPGLLAGGKTSASPELYMVGDYIRSRTIIDDLGGKEFLRTIYDDHNVERFSRMSWPISFEDAWDYWNTKVRATIDTQSEILTLSVRAFTPQDSLRLAQMIVQKSEHLVNTITEPSRQDALKRADDEIKKTQARVAKAQEALRSFRDANSSVNPLLSATSVNDTVTTLMRDKITLETSRNSLQGIVSADSPTMRLVEAQIQAKDKQIKELQAQLTSQTHSDTISGKIAKFEELELENQFAQNLYATAQTAYQQARVQLDKQQLYLSLVATPRIPEYAAYPRRVLDSGLSFAVCLILWGMVALAGAAIRDHVDYHR